MAPNILLFDRCEQGEARLTKTANMVRTAAQAEGIDLTIRTCSRIPDFNGTAGAETLLLGGEERYDTIIINASAAKARDVEAAAELYWELRGQPGRTIYLVDATAKNGNGSFPVHGGNGHMTAPDAEALVRMLSDYLQ